MATRREGHRSVTAFGSRAMNPYTSDQFDLYTGNANPDLARKIARYLGRELGNVEVFEFANENIFVKIEDNARDRDVFVIQPTNRPVQKSIMELLIMIDAFKRASAGRITAVIRTTPTAARTRRTSRACRSRRACRGHDQRRGRRSAC